MNHYFCIGCERWYILPHQCRRRCRPAVEYIRAVWAHHRDDRDGRPCNECGDVVSADGRVTRAVDPESGL